jgi:uncharacterized protein (TIGR03083 family)
VTTRTQGTRLDASSRIAVLEPLRRVNGALLELLRGFSDGDWSRPTIHPDRSVKDLTAHLLHGSLRRVTALRDRHAAPAWPVRGAADLTAFIQADNREFMSGMRRLSPQILVELIERYDPELVRLLEALDPDGPGLGVVWAGEWTSRNWFDVAREYTEKWHHQQQLRDATGRSPLYQPELLSPVLETFARGLPHAWRELAAPEGAAVAVEVGGAVEAAWTLRREGEAWALWSGADADATTRVSLEADLAWRLWTKGLDAARAEASVQASGDRRLAAPLLRFVAIMA